MDKNIQEAVTLISLPQWPILHQYTYAHIEQKFIHSVDQKQVKSLATAHLGATGAQHLRMPIVNSGMYNAMPNSCRSQTLPNFQYL
eukprot:scaffold345599_cov44-Prasinocladus_malaysianus.AAC.1